MSKPEIPKLHVIEVEGPLPALTAAEEAEMDENAKKVQRVADRIAVAMGGSPGDVTIDHMDSSAGVVARRSFADGAVTQSVEFPYDCMLDWGEERITAMVTNEFLNNMETQWKQRPHRPEPRDVETLRGILWEIARVIPHPAVESGDNFRFTELIQMVRDLKETRQ